MKKYDLKEALEKKKIISFSVGPNLIYKELEAAKEDLLDAKDLFSRERFKSAERGGEKTRGVLFILSILDKR